MKYETSNGKDVDLFFTDINICANFIKRFEAGIQMLLTRSTYEELRSGRVSKNEEVNKIKKEIPDEYRYIDSIAKVYNALIIPRKFEIFSEGRKTGYTIMVKALLILCLGNIEDINNAGYDVLTINKIDMITLACVLATDTKSLYVEDIENGVDVYIQTYSGIVNFEITYGENIIIYDAIRTEDLPMAFIDYCKS